MLIMDFPRLPAWRQPLLLACCIIVAACMGRAAATPRAFAVATTQQIISGQPYPMGYSNQLLTVNIGGYIYEQMVDSGSSLLSIPCNTARSLGRNCTRQNNLLSLTNANELAAGQCASNTTNCFTSGLCQWSSALTGGTVEHVYVGGFGAGSISLPNVVSGGSLSWEGLFACYDNYVPCSSSQAPGSCLSSATSCPTILSVNGTCPVLNYGGTGLEAGMLFGQNSLTTQLVNLGIIEPAVGFCFLPPARNTDCTAPPVYNTSRVVFGSGLLPQGISSLSEMQSANLFYSLYPTNLSAHSTEPVFPEFRSFTKTASLPAFGGGVTTINVNVQAVQAGSGGNVFSISVGKVQGFDSNWNAEWYGDLLWDTGAFGQGWVVYPVFDAYYAYFTAALKQAISNNTGPPIVPCGALTTLYCGSNTYPNVSACQQIQFTGTPTAAEVENAQQQLMSLYPAYLNITFDGAGANGGTLSMPTANIVNRCFSSQVTAVAVCSYIYPSSSFWLGSSWFNNHFTFFNTSYVPGSTSYGTVNWSGAMDSCNF